MSENISYHRAGIDDVNILVDYRIEFLIDFAGNQSDELIKNVKQGLHNYFKKALPENSYISYYAKSGDSVVGIGGMVIRDQPGNFNNPSGKVGYLMSMYTVPDFRNKGICSRILTELVEEGKATGINAFELHATTAGEFVYKKQGFEIHHQPTYRRYIL
jgi:predicted acetyltransferase